ASVRHGLPSTRSVRSVPPFERTRIFELPSRRSRRSFAASARSGIGWESSPRRSSPSTNARNTARPPCRVTEVPHSKRAFTSCGRGFSASRTARFAVAAALRTDGGGRSSGRLPGQSSSRGERRALADRRPAYSRTASDPLFSAFLDLSLPERHRLLEPVDRLGARGQCGRPVRRGDGDHYGQLADAVAPHAMCDRDLAQVVLPLQVVGEIGHDLLGHAFVGLVFEVLDGAAARLDPRGADERGYASGALVRDLPDDRPRVDRLVRQAERPAGDRRDHRDLVAVRQRSLGRRVLLVYRVEETVRLLAELERGPDVGDRRRLELALRPTGPLAQPGKDADGYL